MPRLTLLSLLLCIQLSALASDRIVDQRVSVRIVESESKLSLHSSAPFRLTQPGAAMQLAAGAYTLTISEVVPAQQRFHLFSKTFRPHETQKQQDYLAEMRAKGHTNEVVQIGKLLRTESGAALDGRVNWISIVQCATEQEALARKKQLEANEQWTWMHHEITAPGKAFVRIQADDGSLVGSFHAPMTIQSTHAIQIANVDIGFWKENRQRLAYAGELSVGINPEGKMEVIEAIPLEDYLEGVLPAEMHHSWPPEALKAQAVAARSEVLSNLAAKHSLEGVDFCAKEHCRAYLGAGARKPSTHAALIETHSQIVLRDGRIVPTVFSANCGGWTANNDTVWYGPPNDALRARSDALTPAPTPSDLASRLRQPPHAYCAVDKTYFRWIRSYSEKELRDMISRYEKVGAIRDLQLGDRGPSGRLKWMRIVGKDNTVTIHKELPIRRILGGLPSAMFLLDVSADPNGNKTYTFRGAGRGHGVGLCQHGARGMALAGKNHRDILLHYFNGVSLERVL